MADPVFPPLPAAGAPPVAPPGAPLPPVGVVLPLAGPPDLLAASLASVVAQEGVEVTLVLVAMPDGPDPGPLRRALPAALAARLRLLRLPAPGGDADAAAPGGDADAAAPGGDADPAAPGGDADPAAPGGDADPDAAIPAALDLGIRSLAAGPVALLWPGDRFLPGRLAQMLEAMARTGARAALSLVEIEAAGPLPEALMLLAARQMLDLACAPGLGFALLAGNPQGAPGNLVIDRALYDLAGPLVPIGAAALRDLLVQATWWEEPLLLAQVLYAHRPRLPADPDRARLAQEVTLRRLLRRGLSGAAPNPHFPGPGNWPGYLQALLAAQGWGAWWDREAGPGAADWRIYDRPGSGGGGPAP